MFDQGRIVESGAFDELVRKSGIFAALAKAQFIANDLLIAGRDLSQYTR